MKEFENITLEQAKKLLGELKEYQNITRKLGSRGRNLFWKTKDGKHSYKVEHHTGLSQDEAWAAASGVFHTSFGETVSRDSVVFESKEGLLGGIKVFRDDFLVDMSYENIEKKLQK